jgi:hypothetical protein
MSAFLLFTFALFGKSGGYRLIYQLESPTNVILLLIYFKSEQADVAAEEIKLVIEEFQKEGSSSSQVNQE